jgi:hypothetical protein
MKDNVIKNNVIIIHGILCLEIFNHNTKESIITLLYDIRKRNSNFEQLVGGSKFYNENYIVSLYFDKPLLDKLYELKNINDRTIFNMHVEYIIEQIKIKTNEKLDYYKHFNINL